jgi:hypothetical protein
LKCELTEDAFFSCSMSFKRKIEEFALFVFQKRALAQEENITGRPIVTVFAYITREIVFTCGCHKNQKTIKSQLSQKPNTKKTTHNRPEAKIIISFVKEKDS